MIDFFKKRVLYFSTWADSFGDGINNIKQMYYNVSNNGDVATRVGIFGALKLYMDFITIFIHLLQFFALSKNRD